MDFQNIIIFGIIVAVRICFTDGGLSPQKRQASESECPDGWTLYEDSCYFYSDKDHKTWDAAETACFKVGGRLVEIEHAEENTYLVDLKKKFSSFTIPAWIGLYARQNEEMHVWDSTGKVPTYTNLGKPISNVERVCVRIHHTGMWSDIMCKLELPYFCERLVSAICPPRLTYFMRSCYKYKDSYFVFHALTSCSADEGHPVEITSAAETAFLINLIKVASHKLPAWIQNRDINVMTGIVCDTNKQLGGSERLCTFIRNAFCERPAKDPK